MLFFEIRVTLDQFASIKSFAHDFLVPLDDLKLILHRFYLLAHLLIFFEKFGHFFLLKLNINLFDFYLSLEVCDRKPVIFLYSKPSILSDLGHKAIIEAELSLIINSMLSFHDWGLGCKSKLHDGRILHKAFNLLKTFICSILKINELGYCLVMLLGQ